MKIIKLVCTFTVLLLVTGVLQSHAQSNADSLLDFIAANKNRSSLCLSRNDTILAKWQEDKLMPLASTVKILVAIEFAKQAGNNVIDENSRVPLAELDRYYIPNTDGDAHPAWLKYLEKNKLIKDSSVSLLDVARGMMIFSSNANTEYLSDLLGLDNIKSNITLFGLSKHTAIFPLVSSLFLYQNPRKLKEDVVIKGIRSLTEEQYCKTIFEIHKALKYDSVLKPRFRPQDLSMKMQKLWSDRLPASTTHEYAQLCRILNNRKYLDENSYGMIAEILETVMENPANVQWLKHAGMKGGSTPWVLTKALYATTKDGARIEMAYFFNGLTPSENEHLQQWMNAFELETLRNETFRQKIGMKLR